MQQDMHGRDHGAEGVMDQRQRFVDDIDVLQELVDHSCPLQQRQPGIGPHQYAGPERQDHQCEDADAPSFGDRAGSIGDRITEQQRQRRHHQADLEGQQEAAPVDLFTQDAAVVLQRETVMVDRLPAEPPDREHDQQQNHN